MDITIYSAMLPHDDPDASLAFYRDTLGFEVRNDVEYGGMPAISPAASRRYTLGGMPTSSVKRVLKVPSEEQPTAKQTSVTLRSPCRSSAIARSMRRVIR